MVAQMKTMIIAPIIDKEHLIVEGFGYNETFTEGIFSVTHVDTMPWAGQPDFQDRVAAF